jgi:arginine utilization protein RocB
MNRYFSSCAEIGISSEINQEFHQKKHFQHLMKVVEVVKWLFLTGRDPEIAPIIVIFFNALVSSSQRLIFLAVIDS